MTDQLFTLPGLGEPGGPQWDDGDDYARCVTILGRYFINDDVLRMPNILTTHHCTSIAHGKELAAEHYRETMESALKKWNWEISKPDEQDFDLQRFAATFDPT